MLDKPVVLGMEHSVNRGQADVLIHAAVAGHVVGVKQFVVVKAGRRRAGIDDVVGVRCQRGAEVVHRHRVVRDIDQELVPGAHRIGEADAVAAISSWVTLDQHVARHHDQRKTMIPLFEVAVGVGRQQWHVIEIGIGQVDAENIACLGLEDFPCRHAADFDVVASAELSISTEIAVGDQPAGRHRGAVKHLIGAEEHLVRRMR